MIPQNIPLKQLHPNTGQIVGLPKNPRFIRDDRFKKLVKSIEDDPEMLELRELIVIHRAGIYIIIGGNMRYRALKDLGYKEAPCKVLKEDTPVEKLRAYVIKDNVGYGQDDYDDLANDWDMEELEDWGVEFPDLGDQLEVEETAEDDDYEEPNDLQVDVVLGDLIEIGKHRLLCGDSTDSEQVEKLMNGEKADCVITDPPYGYNYKSNWGAGHEELINDDRILDFLPNSLVFSSGFIFVFCSWKNIEEWIVYFKTHYSLNNLLVWSKGGGGIGDLKKTFSTDYELCMVSNNGNEINGKRIGSVWEHGKDSEVKSDGLHPTPKPLSLINEMILQSTKGKNIILDFFLGSGSTMVAAHQLNRKCYGMELDPKYCQVIIDRMTKLDPSLEVKINGEPYTKE